MMASDLPTLLRMTLTGAIVILAVLLARLCLRRAPRKYVCFLWLAVLFRLLCPVTVHAPTSAVPEKLESGAVVERWTSSYAEETKIIWEDMEGFAEAVAAGRPVEHTSKANSIRPGTDYVVTASDGVSPPRTAGETWLPLLGWVWLSGAAGLLLWSAWRYLRLLRRLREAVKLEERVYEAEGLDSPFVLGILRPRVYLPWGMEKEERKWVLLHERAHIRRLDPVWKLLGWLALCLHWFNPLCWLAFSLAMQDMEGACDEAVVRLLDGEERAAYSRLLLALSAGRPLFAATPLGFGEGNVKQRIRSVLRWRKPKWWMALLAVLLLAAVVLLFVFGPGAKQPEPEPTPPPSAGNPAPSPTAEPTPAPSPMPGYPVEAGWTQLTREEAAEAREALEPVRFGEDGSMWVNPVDPCFTSYYTDPRELNFSAFMRYFDDPSMEMATEEDYRALVDAGYLWGSPWLHVEDREFWLRRIPARAVEDALRLYYDIGLEDLKTDYRTKYRYLPQTDCFYSITSDFGPGTFRPEWGERKDDVVRLWQSKTCLTCRKLEDRWIILSFYNENYDGADREEDEGWPALSRDYYGSPEYVWVLTPAETPYGYQEGEETVTGTIPAGWRLRLKRERFTPEGEIWLEVEQAAVKVPESRQVWVRAEDVLPWTPELAERTVWPVYIPAGVTYYPLNFGDWASDSPEECIRPENEAVHGYNLEGVILERRGEYARMGISGGLEVWVANDGVTVGRPKEENAYTQTVMLAAGREKARTLGYPLADWGTELVWHRGKENTEDSAYYAAYFPTAAGEGTVCVLFDREDRPAEALLIPPGAEEWP